MFSVFIFIETLYTYRISQLYLAGVNMTSQIWTWFKVSIRYVWQNHKCFSRRNEWTRRKWLPGPLIQGASVHWNVKCRHVYEISFSGCIECWKKWQLSLQPVAKIWPKWRHFRSIVYHFFCRCQPSAHPFDIHIYIYVWFSLMWYNEFTLVRYSLLFH